MKKALFLAAGLALFVGVASPAFAQGGCVNSPENPTAVLALVGSAGAVFASLRNRRGRASKPIQKRR
jgi:XrtJ-associated TM-motif-TM protein